MAIFGLIGYPLGHSFSPKYMNALFRKEGLLHYYEAFSLEKEKLGRFFDNLDLFNVRGLNVTIPYKTEVLTYMDELSEEVEVMNACNVIDIKSGKLTAYNTDWYGFSKALEIKGITLSEKTAFIYGSGGAAKSVFYAFSKAGANHVTFLARTPEKAMEIIDNIGSFYPLRTKIIPWKNNIERELKGEIEKADIVINTTPLGMYPHTDSMPPIPDTDLAGKIFFDLVYNPQNTKFLEFAKERGAFIIGGIYMLMYQGARALSIWLGGDFEKKVEKVFEELNFI